MVQIYGSQLNQQHHYIFHVYGHRVRKILQQALGHHPHLNMTSEKSSFTPSHTFESAFRFLWQQYYDKKGRSNLLMVLIYSCGDFQHTDTPDITTSVNMKSDC